MTATERLAWLKERQTGLGSSDAPNLVGVGYRTALDVYREKTDPVSDTPPAGNLRRGLELEPLVAQMYHEVMGVAAVPPTPGGERLLVRHPERPWQLCSPDAYRSDDGTPVQFKTTAGFSDDWGPTGSDQVPAYIRVERQHEMGVLGVGQMDLIALDVIAWEPRIYRLMFDAEMFHWLTEAEAEFWTRVDRRMPVDSDWESRFANYTRKLLDDGTPDLGDEVAALVERRKELLGISDEAQAEADRIKAEIEKAMGDHAKATAGGWKLKRTLIPASTYTVNRKPSVRLDIRAIRERVKAC